MLLYFPPVVWLSLCHSSWLWQTDNLVSWATYQAGHGRHYHGASGFSFVSLVILIKSSSGRPLFSLLFHDEIYEAAILWVCHLQGSEVIGTLMIQTRYLQVGATPAKIVQTWTERIQIFVTLWMQLKTCLVIFNFLKLVFPCSLCAW